ncbi:MAG: hypothetical protein NC124_17140 [Clostridium sp.]|nr:hypothetical protein [Clostridium sp.]
MKVLMRFFNITAILTLFFLLTACANKNISKKNLPDSTPINQGDDSSAIRSLPELDSHSVITDLPLNDDSITIGEVSLTLSENKQDILAKLEEAGLDYSEVQPDSPNEVNYDLYYNAAGCLQLYFLNDTCVRIRLINLDSVSDWDAQTAKGLRPGDTYFQMTDLYGDDYKTHTYAGKEIYTIYRYSMGDYICEFGVPRENTGPIYNIDIYLSNQSPIYKYGEEIIDPT